MGTEYIRVSEKDWRTKKFETGGGVQKNYNNPEARNILQKFRLLINILSVDEQIIDISLSSAFHDYEDAIQYHVAVKSKVDVLLTRNLKDFKKSSIPVSTAASFLHT
jgi:hypothetical protein